MIFNEEKLDGCIDDVIKLVKLLEKKYGNVTVNSGFRSPEYNASVGGSPTSKHCTGEAVDVGVKDVSPIKVAAYVLENSPKVNGIGIALYHNYCHFDFRPTPRAYWVYGKNGKVA